MMTMKDLFFGADWEGKKQSVSMLESQKLLYFANREEEEEYFCTSINAHHQAYQW